jgi:thiamine kinase-like enzyme
MLISNQTVFSYLVEQGICRSDDSPPQKILRISGKNFNLLLQFVDRPPLLVKQEEAVDGAFDNDFVPESALQQLLQQFPALASLRQWVPPILHYDPTNSILVSQFLEEYSDLSDVYSQPERFDPGIAVQQGQLLGQLHRLTFRQDAYRQFLGTQDASLAEIQLPGCLAPIPPLTPEMFACIRSDALQFFRLYQRYDSLSQAVDSLASKWQPCCLVHQDLRFANWLLHRHWQDVMPAVRLIDWEKVGWGDPLTDLADLISAYLERWLESLIPYAGLDVQTMLRSASIPL